MSPTRLSLARRLLDESGVVVLAGHRRRRPGCATLKAATSLL
ncbi:hypothetical protein [Streptomyces galbus]